MNSIQPNQGLIQSGFNPNQGGFNPSGQTSQGMTIPSNAQPARPGMVAPAMPLQNPAENQKIQGQDAKDIGIDSKIHSEYGEEFQKTGKTTENCYQSCISGCGECCKIACCLCVLCECGPVSIVTVGNVGFVLEYDKLIKKVGPGLVTINPCSQKVVQFSVLQQVVSVPSQKLLTQDQLMINCNTYAAYQYTKPELAYFKIQQIRSFIPYTIKGIIKSLVAQRTFDQLQTNSAEFNKACMEQVKRKFNDYGIQITNIEIREVVLPYNMVRSMAQVAQSHNENKQKLASAHGYLKSAQSYAQAAKSYNGADLALQLNYYSVLKSMTMNKQSTLFVKDSIIKI